MPSRRALLAAASAAVTAGCLTSIGEPGTSEEPDDERSPTGATHTGEPPGTDDCTGGYNVTADSFDPAVDLTVALDEAERSLVATAIDRGAAHTRLYDDSPPVPDGVYLEREGRYYETAVERVDRTEVPALLTNVEWEKGKGAPANATVVAFDDLPAVDREALRSAIDGEPQSSERDGHPTERLSIREAPIPYPDGTDGSMLADDGKTWVRWRDRTYRVWTGAETTTIRNRYRIEATVIGDAATFREHVADRYLLALSELSDAEREILRTATRRGYEECEPASEGLAALQERLREDATLPRPAGNAWYVAFDGTRYRLQISRWVH